MCVLLCEVFQKQVVGGIPLVRHSKGLGHCWKTSRSCHHHPTGLFSCSRWVVCGLVLIYDVLQASVEDYLIGVFEAFEAGYLVGPVARSVSYSVLRPLRGPLHRRTIGRTRTACVEAFDRCRLIIVSNAAVTSAGGEFTPSALVPSPILDLEFLCRKTGIAVAAPDSIDKCTLLACSTLAAPIRGGHIRGRRKGWCIVDWFSEVSPGICEDDEEEAHDGNRLSDSFQAPFVWCPMICGGIVVWKESYTTDC